MLKMVCDGTDYDGKTLISVQGIAIATGFVIVKRGMFTPQGSRGVSVITMVCLQRLYPLNRTEHLASLPDLLVNGLGLYI